MRALGIHVPQGCKATLYNEKRHFAAHITGPKNYCSTGQLDGIHIVGLQDVADVASVAGELVKAEDTIKELSKDIRLMKQNMTSEMHRKLSDTRDGLLRKIKQIEVTPGPTGPRGLRGLSVTGPAGATGPRGLRGFTGATGTKGDRGVAGERGIRGREGKVGPRGDKGTSVQGPRGEQGPPGLGLQFTTFEFNKRFSKGEYVFSRSRKDPTHDSMYIAEKHFNSHQKFPFQDLDSGHWIEFAAPRGKDGKDGVSIRGERGEKGEKGDQGDRGEKGDQGDRGEKGDQGGEGRSRQ